jgi:hypothetical protein
MEPPADFWLRQMFRGVVETNHLLTRSDFVSQIPTVLHILGQAMRADRVYVFEFQTDSLGQLRVRQRH